MSRTNHPATSPRRRAFVALSLALAAVFAVGTAVAGGGLRDLLRGAEVIEGEADGRLDALDREVDAMRGVLRSLPRSERRQVRARMARMDRLIEELRDDTDALAALVVDVSEEARIRRSDRRGRGHGHGHSSAERRGRWAPDQHSACGAKDFTNVVRSMEMEWFDNGKMEVLRSAAGSRWFTVAQVKALVDQFSFDSYQVDAAAMLHGRTVDLENWYRVYDSLTFSSSKRELRQRVGV